DEQGPAQTRLQLRRDHHLLRVHAGGRDGKRPSRELLSLSRTLTSGVSLAPAQQHQLPIAMLADEDGSQVQGLALMLSPDAERHDDEAGRGVTELLLYWGRIAVEIEKKRSEFFIKAECVQGLIARDFQNFLRGRPIR